MAIRVGSARNDENGRISGGAAGDQTGREVMIQDYYMHKKGWYMLRPKSIDDANRIAQAMTDACNNNNIGYDQFSRLGVITQVKKYGSLKKIAVKTEADCGTLVRACCIEAGFDPGNFSTANEVEVLKKTGRFEDPVSVTSSTVLYNGDILVTKTKGHTVIVVSGRARTATNTTGNSASASKPSKSTLTADGYWGAATIKRLQQIFGTTQDGVISNQYSSEKTRNPGLAAATGWEWKTKPAGSSSLIKAIQKKVGATQDGHIGKNTIKAMQKWLGTTQDGVISKPSSMVKALQRWCNKQ